MSRAKQSTNVTLRDQKRYAHARARGQAVTGDPLAVRSARYDKSRDRVKLAFLAGVEVSIPRTMIPGLENAGQSNLKIVHVSPAGDALSWPALDVDVHVLGLVERVLGNHLFTEENGRRRGRRASKAKASAANQG
jgi:hypothetical protein